VRGLAALCRTSPLDESGYLDRGGAARHAGEMPSELATATLLNDLPTPFCGRSAGGPAAHVVGGRICGRVIETVPIGVVEGRVYQKGSGRRQDARQPSAGAARESRRGKEPPNGNAPLWGAGARPVSPRLALGVVASSTCSGRHHAALHDASCSNRVNRPRERSAECDAHDGLFWQPQCWVHVCGSDFSLRCGAAAGCRPVPGPAYDSADER
jgi:hypothetical protein